MRRKSLPPDTRPNWRDPSMPVIRDYRMGDGSKRTEVDPNYEQRYREHMITAAPHPDWKNDPTYDIAKKGRKR